MNRTKARRPDIGMLVVVQKFFKREALHMLVWDSRDFHELHEPAPPRPGPVHSLPSPFWQHTGCPLSAAYGQTESPTTPAPSILAGNTAVTPVYPFCFPCCFSLSIYYFSRNQPSPAIPQARVLLPSPLLSLSLISMQISRPLASTLPKRR